MKLFIIFVFLAQFSAGTAYGVNMDEHKIKEIADELTTGEAPYPAVSVVAVKKEKDIFYSTDHNVIDKHSFVELGSLTKAFTALLLSRAHVEGHVNIYDSVNETIKENWLPQDIDEHVNLLYLATHSAGFSRIPNNLPSTDPNQPYKDYSLSLFKAYLSNLSFQRPEPDSCELTEMDFTGSSLRPADQCNHYSNTGVSLLGHVLAKSWKNTFEAVLTEQITTPLELGETIFSPNEKQSKRIVQGHNFLGEPAIPWNFASISPAGGLKSTPSDMIKFLKVLTSATGHQLEKAIHFSQLMHKSLPTTHPSGTDPTIYNMGIGWHMITTKPDETIYWHNGGTGGFLTCLCYNPEKETGVFTVANQFKVLNNAIDYRIDEACFKILASL